MERTTPTIPPAGPLPTAPALRRGHGVRLMSCAVAMSACAEAAPPPVTTLPTPLTTPAGPAPQEPPKAYGDPSTADWAAGPPPPCEPPDQAPTGAPCDNAVDDCGLDRLCIEGWPGGFCTGACSEDADCPGAGATCVLPSSEMPGFCAVSCMDDVECGPGYGCDGRTCWPVPPSFG